MDYRGLLHRDGSVLSSVSLTELAQPEELYRKLGCKLAVGMPFKDIATSDTLLLREVPRESDAAGRQVLRRLQEVGVHVITPLAHLAVNPFPGALALIPLKYIAAEGQLPEFPPGTMRYVVSIDGTETESELAALDNIHPTFALLNIGEGTSRVHASRRLFDYLRGSSVEHVRELSVIHHRVFDDQPSRDKLVITAGSEVGSLLVDGLGDGVLLECEMEDVEYLRTTSFGLLQGSRMRNTKTEFVSCPSCGRTLFDLQEVTDQIKTKTGHLPGVAIAVMGCIVNGPGEMADADFGYVGGAPGKIDLYVGKEVVQRGIPMDTAPDALVQLIKDHGKWVEPSSDEDEDEDLEAAAAARLANGTATF